MIEGQASVPEEPRQSRLF